MGMRSTILHLRKPARMIDHKLPVLVVPSAEHGRNSHGYPDGSPQGGTYSIGTV